MTKGEAMGKGNEKIELTASEEATLREFEAIESALVRAGVPLAESGTDVFRSMSQRIDALAQREADVQRRWKQSDEQRRKEIDLRDKKIEQLTRDTCNEKAPSVVFEITETDIANAIAKAIVERGAGRERIAAIESKIFARHIKDMIEAFR